MSKTAANLYDASLSPSSSSSERKRKRNPHEAGNGEIKHKKQELLSSPVLDSPLRHTANMLSNTHSTSNQGSNRSSKGSFDRSQMYNFGPSMAAKHNVVDLTSSPTSTPSRHSPLQPRKAPQNMGVRRIVVKNFQSKPRTDPEVYVQAVLQKSNEMVIAEYGNSALPCSMEEMYQGVEKVCRMGYAERVNESLIRQQEKIMSTQFLPKLLSVASSNATKEALLLAVLSAWQDWQKHSLFIQSVYMFMDRTYLLRQVKSSLQESSVAIFRKYVFEHPELQSAIVDGTCSIITNDRIGDASGRDVTRNAISMFHELGVYTKVFEPKLLEVSQSFIFDYAERTAKEFGLLGYITSSLELMDKEMDRVGVYGLDSSTRKDLLALLEQHLIQRQQDRLTHDGEVAELLNDNDVDALGKLYGMLDRMQLTARLRKPFEKWIDTSGTRIIFEGKEDDMVVNLLALKQQLDHIWVTAYLRNKDIGHGLRVSFEGFMNKTKKTAATHGTDNSKTGEMIAKYVDMLLRGGSKVIPAAINKPTPNKPIDLEDEKDEDEEPDEEKEVDEQLEQVLDLFRFIHGKAVFEAFYKKDLARRLLLNRSASAQAELSMLSRLKLECGPQFTANLDQMFKDIDLGKEEMASYKTLLAERNERSTIDLSVNVLSQAAWPTYNDISVNLPPAVKAEQDKFENIYKLKHTGRKLYWKHALSHCVLKAKYPRGVKELVVSGFQAIVLLLFNGVSADDSISYERLKAETGLPEAELKRTLQSLACAKIRPLRKEPQGREINDTDTFAWNLKFGHEKFRIKINSVQLRETKEENKETHERVAADRNFETQAAIVRIMKAKKTIHHNLLVTEVIESTRKRGVLSVQDIKKNIDRLIDKEYMEREEGNKYSYIA